MTKSSFYTGAPLTTVAPPVPDLDSPGTGESTAPSSFFHDSTAYDNIADPDAFAAAAAASAAAAAASAAATAAALGPVTASDFIVGSASAALSAERVVTDTPSVTWDLATAGQAKVNIPADAVTFAKMQNIVTDSLIGRDTATTGDPENILLNATLEMDGAGNLRRAALTGDVTAPAGSNATTIAANAVDNTKLRDSALLSVIGRSANSAGDPADIAAVAASGSVLRESGSTIGFGTIATAGITNDAVDNTKLRNSAARSVIGNSTNGSTDPADIVGTTDQVLRVDTAGTSLGFGTIATGGITAAAVTYAKIQNVAAARLLGNPTGGAAAPSEISLGATLSFTGSTLQRDVLGGDVTSAAGSTSVVVNQASSAFALTGDISPTALAADVNDYNPTGLSTASVIRQAISVAAVNITGLAGGADGRLIILHNISANTIVLKDESVSSTAANRFALTADITLSPDSVVMLQYDSTSTRWRNVGGSGGGGGGASTAEAFVTIGNTAGLSAERALAVSGLATLTDGGVNSTVTIGSPAATQADQETATSTTTSVTPGRQQFHPSAAKAWVRFNSAGTVAASYNITSITDSGIGDWSIVIATDFSSANYGAAGIGGIISGVFAAILNVDTATAAGQFDVGYFDGGVDNGSRTDPSGLDAIFLTFFGDQ
jgi:hypothetical protein